jgi:multiple sugar transport system permease protein
MTQGGPGRSLETLGIYVSSTTNALNIGYASALSVALFLLSLAITVLYLRWIYTDT